MPLPFHALDQPARHGLKVAGDEALQLQVDFVGPEHLLLGLLRDRTSPAAELLGSMGLTFSRLKDELAAESPPAPGWMTPLEMPLTTEARWIYERALAEATELGSGSVTPEHVLLAIVQAPSVEPLLRKFGAQPDVVRRKVLGMIDTRTDGS